MSSETDWRLLVPAPLRALPADLVAVIVFVCATAGAALLPIVDETPLRLVLGLPFVLFVPGYAFIAALFPEAGTGPKDENWEGVGESAEGIDGLERVALSFGTSIAISPLIGLVLNFTPWGIRLVPIVVSLSAFTLVVTAVAAQRRQALSVDERFEVPYQTWIAAAKTELLYPNTKTDAILNVVLAASVITAAASVGYAVAVPKEGESFSELYLLTENADNELVADDYPANLTQGEPASLYVGIGNQEHEPVNYTLLVELQRVSISNNSTTVVEKQRIHRLETRLAHNETWHHNHTVQPQLTGKRLRLTYLLYKSDPPAEPTIENAYQETHLWVNVTQSNTPSNSTKIAA
ncbi:hypothetical protein AUR64_14255 [Haloprofundus marisrubri]|uniref:DUF1616 domain-containing protein n=1 Tax=Haloprofundus marisrubri TaxID=1514971 RepID=A0A0W1R776_9EURY|nr:DUF1616 domain-containing protein [Haloprofundus marisrubri]KTG08967.1 hypothetical protein AUR64_14255 [Haloprofundus marisrubri]